VLDKQQKETPPLGRLALKENVLTMKQVFKVLSAQSESDIRFGEMAISLSFMTNQQLMDLLKLQKKSRPSLNKIVTDMGLAKTETLKTLHVEFLEQIAELVL